MTLKPEVIDLLKGMLNDASDGQLGRVNTIVDNMDVEDDVKAAYKEEIKKISESTIAIDDALAAPGVQEFIDSKVADATKESKELADKSTADHKELLVDAIVALATTVKAEGINPLDMETSVAEYKDSQKDKSLEDLQTAYDDLKKQAIALGTAPAEELDNEDANSEDGVQGKAKKDDKEDKEDDKDEGPEIHTVKDVFDAVTADPEPAKQD